MSLYADLAEPGTDLVFDVHADSIDYIRSSQGVDQPTQQLSAIFNPVHETFDAQGRPVVTENPTVDIRVHAVDFVPESQDTVTHQGTTYTVQDVVPKKMFYRLKLTEHTETRRR